MTGLLANFLTARAASRHMAKQGSGVILSLTSASARATSPLMGNTGPADAATETFLRYLAAEVGPYGVRVVGLHTAGVVETLTRERTRERFAAVHSDGPAPDTLAPDTIVRMLGEMTMLRRAPRLSQVTDAAVYLASDRAGGITSTILNVTCGLVPG